MKHFLNKNLIQHALSIIHSNHLTQSEISSLFGTEPSTTDSGSPNLENAFRQLADLFLSSDVTIQQAADLFREMATRIKNNS